MEQKDILRLRDEQDKAVRSTEEQIRTWEKFKSDYVALQDRLKTLPDKVTHQVMVPFGSKAFMPGKLIHTNEVLVLLGDNWFAERSAKQASEIIDRRLVGINKQLKDLEKQKELLQPRIDFTSELQEISQCKGDMVDIREEYNPEKEKRWREQHRKNVHEHKKKVREDKHASIPNKTENADIKPLTDEELWARLDELEDIEKSRQELSRLNLTDEVDQKTVPGSERTVRWADEELNNSQDLSSNEAESDEGDTTQNRPKSITFSHTKSQDDSQDRDSEKSKMVAKSGEVTIQITSPGDIYKLFNPDTTPVRSILKPASKEITADDLTGHVKENTEIKVNRTRKNYAVMEAFSGSVIERDIKSKVNSTAREPEKLPSNASEGSHSQPTRKPVSKFKANRQKQKQTGDR